MMLEMIYIPYIHYHFYIFLIVRIAFESTPEQDLDRHTRKLERRKLELRGSKEMMLSMKKNLLIKINELDTVLSGVG